MFTVDVLKVDVLKVDVLKVDVLKVDVLKVDVLKVDVLKVDVLKVDVIEVIQMGWPAYYSFDLFWFFIKKSSNKKQTKISRQILPEIEFKPS